MLWSVVNYFFNKSRGSERNPEEEPQLNESFGDPFEEVRRDILRKRSAREAEQEDADSLSSGGLDTDLADPQVFEPSKEVIKPQPVFSEPMDSLPRETSETSETSVWPKPLADAQAGINEDLESQDFESVKLGQSTAMDFNSELETRDNREQTKSPARGNLETARLETARSRRASNQTRLRRRIRANFRNPALAKEALITGEILAQPLALRTEGERRI